MIELGPSQDGNVVAEDRHRATVHGSVAPDLAIAGSSVAILDSHRAREGAELPERSGVEEGIEVVADGPGARRVHAGHLLLSPHLPSDLLGSRVQIRNRIAH